MARLVLSAINAGAIHPLGLLTDERSPDKGSAPGG
jgi:hypothetical protein